jgi:hypothetical protein
MRSELVRDMTTTTEIHFVGRLTFERAVRDLLVVLVHVEFNELRSARTKSNLRLARVYSKPRPPPPSFTNQLAPRRWVSEDLTDALGMECEPSNGL